MGKLRILFQLGMGMPFVIGTRKERDYALFQLAPDLKTCRDASCCRSLLSLFLMILFLGLVTLPT